MTRPSGPHHMAARLNKKPLSDRPRRAEAKSSSAAQTATTVQFWSSDKRLMLSNKEGCIHLKHTNTSDISERQKEEENGCL
ncbi:Hypothetical predicted protein [Xyrichtys novacula]|uniref:Uncharacterized protein n=1 Tax=Xyrichtys novacula TaxID=13765 RepID=A0AAV1FKK9_XYRNO|nr:Hypothetical predicted protein [Xyrichtys novacula]